MNDESSDLSLTGRKWQHVPSSSPMDPGSVSLSPWILTLLQQRGLSTPEEIESYLDTSLRRLEDPATIADMPQAVKRLADAIEHEEAVTIYGDYDVDGVCSTTILVEFLREAGAQVDFYIPDRRTEGYGVNEDAIRSIAPKSQLLVTTDCGITAHKSLSLARDLGLDVIVVDHHQVPETLPPALALLDPHRPDCEFPFKGLCAAGVAFMLTAALRRHLREANFFDGRQEPDIRKQLDVVAVATVADMVPLNGTNRILVAAGLRQMARQPRIGLAALMDVSRITPSQINASDLGFKLGPRINAQGRLAHAGAGVELLLTHSPDRAAELAQVLDQANLDRRELERNTVDQAIERVETIDLSEKAALVVYDPTWHPGVLGLVASRLARRFCRPTIVIGEGGKGSARSIEGVNIHTAIGAGEEHTIAFGGHPAAAGLTIDPDQIAPFEDAVDAAVRLQKGEPPFTATLTPDLEVPSHNLTLQMVDELNALGPFGQKNPEPLFFSRNLPIRSKYVVGKTHLKLVLGEEGHDAIAFGLGEHLDDLSSNVDILYRLERNVFRNKERLQLKIEDLRPTPLR